MAIKGQKIEPVKFSVDKDISTDELKFISGNSIELVQGKRTKETIVSVEEAKVYVNSKSKAFWRTDKVKVKDADKNEVEVEKNDDGFSFEAVAGTTYLITVAGAYFGEAFLTWEELKESGNGETYGYDASAISDTSIGDYAFSECAGITSINLPDGLTSIGDGALRLFP